MQNEQQWINALVAFPGVSSAFGYSQYYNEATIQLQETRCMRNRYLNQQINFIF